MKSLLLLALLAGAVPAWAGERFVIDNVVLILPDEGPAEIIIRDRIFVLILKEGWVQLKDALKGAGR